MAVTNIDAKGMKKKRRMAPKGRSVDLAALEEIQSLVGDEPRRRDLLIEHLHKIQDRYHHISAKHLVALAHEMRLSSAEVYEVATFYSMFQTQPVGRINVSICTNVSCMLRGADDIVDHVDGVRGRSECVHRGQAPLPVHGVVLHPRVYDWS